MTVIDTVEACTVEDGDTIRYVTRKHDTFTLDVKGEPLDTGDTIRVRGYSHESGDNVTVVFRPDQRVEIIGS